MASFKIGDTCVLHGLKAQPSFNGHMVTLVEWMAKEGRFVLKPIEPNTSLPPVLAIKPDNLKLAPVSSSSTQKYLAGTRLILNGLKAQPQFNGHEVVVTGFLSDQGRYKVKPSVIKTPLPHTLAIKPENVKPVASEAPPRRGLTKSSSQKNLGSSLLGGFRQLSQRSLSTSQHGDLENNGPSSRLNKKLEVLHKSGTEFTLRGLRSVPHFNGHNVVIKCYLSDEGRYQVAPVESDSSLPAEFAVKPDNLIPTRPKVQRRSSNRSLRSRENVSNEPNNESKLVKSNSQRSILRMVPSNSQYNLTNMTEQAGPSTRRKSLSGIGSRRNSTSGMHSMGSEAIEVFSAQPGDKMVVFRLQSQPNWNGQHVIVKGFQREQGRYQVSPINPTSDMPPVLALKPDNLRPDATKDGKDEHFHHITTNRVPMNIEVRHSEDMENNVAPDKVSSLATTRSYQKTFPVGTRVLVKKSDNPQLNEHLFRVSKVFEEKREYQLEAVGPEAMDACLGGDVVLGHDDLMVEPTDEEATKLLEPGSRGVIQGVSASLNGHLIKVVKYDQKRKRYFVEPLGRLAKSSAGSGSVLLSRQNIKAAPVTSFWTTISKRGRKMFVPCHVKVSRTKSGQNSIMVYISSFPGIDKVTAVGRFLLGEERCDWNNPHEVAFVLSRSGSNPITVEVKDRAVSHSLAENEIVVRREKHLSTIEALVEFELIADTGRSVEVEGYGPLPVYKLNFSHIDSCKDQFCDFSIESPRSVFSPTDTHEMACTVQCSNRNSLLVNSSISSIRSDGLFGDDNADDTVDTVNMTEIEETSKRVSFRKEGSNRRLGKGMSQKRLDRGEGSSCELGKKKKSSGKIAVDSQGDIHRNETNTSYEQIISAILDNVALKECEQKKIEEDLRALRAKLEQAQKMAASCSEH